MLSLLGSLRGGSSFITNSLRFRSSASAYLSRTFVTPTNSTVFTWSGWVKRGSITGTFRLFGASTNTSFGFNSSDQLSLTLSGAAAVTTTAVYRDPSAWYHIIYVQNGAAQTIYVNGSSVGTGTTANTVFNTAIAHQLGAANTANYFDGYLTEVHFIDGQALTPASFGAINSSTGVWAPRPYTGTYGTNGFYLKFADASAATAAAIGKDSSGNGNNWTPSNISVTAGATYDSMIDVPVNYNDGGNGRGNYAVWNPVSKTGAAVTTDGNLGNSFGSLSFDAVISSIAIQSKSYAEFYGIAFASAVRGVGVKESIILDNNVKYFSDGRLYFNNVLQGAVPTYGSGDIIGIDCDPTTRQVRVYKNNIQIGSTGTITGTAPLFFCAEGSENGTGSSTGGVNFGQRPFTYTPPAGFRALNTQNLPTPSIVNGANFMAATTYTGDATARSLLNTVNNVSFQPNLVWIKSRTPGATSHALFDSTRGTTKYLSSDTTAAETTLAQSLTAFNADGFSLGTDTTLVNANANSYIAWQWKESALAGLDVVSYTGTGVDRTVAHNLGVAPAMVIVKRSQTGGTGNWQVRHASIAAANSIQLNLPNAAAAATTVWASTAPSSSVFTVGSSTDVNASGISYVAYCFAEIAGFSRFGSYTGNGLADGPFAFCNFRPKWVMYKSTTEAVANWHIFDAARDTYNYVNEQLSANASTTATVGGPFIDILSNGFKLRTASISHNAGGVTYIFAAFAETPSKYALAR